MDLVWLDTKEKSMLTLEIRSIICDFSFHRVFVFLSGVDPYQDITLVKKVPYSNSFVEAAWPLGSAIEVASSS
jgi:hypothetical protein